MANLRTSAAFYYRGIKNNNKQFGIAVQGNYSIVQPTGVFINSLMYPVRNRPSMFLLRPRM